MDNPAASLYFPTQWNLKNALGGIIEHIYQSSLAYTSINPQELVLYQGISPPIQPRGLNRVGARVIDNARVQRSYNREQNLNRDAAEVINENVENPELNPAIQNQLEENDNAMRDN